MASKLTLTMACNDYDRTAALATGEIGVDGVDLIYLTLPVEEIFWRMLQYQEFDAAEMSMSAYTMLLSREERQFTAIPVFTSKAFRHSCIFINANSGIRKPEDLRGRKVGVPEYHMTAALWQRGLLQHEYGVLPHEIQWFTGGLQEIGRVERVRLDLPGEISVTPVLDDTLDAMLFRGDLDALLGPYIPPSFHLPSSPVVRLFPDHQAAEKDYYLRTGIIPIMHAIVIKTDLLDRHPWLGQAFVKAFVAAKDACLKNLYKTAALHDSLLFLTAAVEEHISLFGPDFWSYGVGPNERSLQALLQYSAEQHLSCRQVDLKELFAPSTAAGFHV